MAALWQDPDRPAHTLVLDGIHATESLWDAAHALRGEPHPPRTAWVRTSLEPRLAGQTDAVLTTLEAEANDPACAVTQRQAVLDLRAVRINGHWDT